MIANFFFGIGSMIVFATTSTMLTEFMPKKASSGIALNNFVRNIFSCVGTVVAVPLIEAIGNGWLCSGFGIINIIIGFSVIWALKKYGDQWRISMQKQLD